MLLKMKRPIVYTLVPMIFVMLMAFWAGAIKLLDFYEDGNYLLVGIDLIVLITSVLVMLEAGSKIIEFRSRAD